jgi:hypothetical protein
MPPARAVRRLSRRPKCRKWFEKPRRRNPPTRPPFRQHRCAISGTAPEVDRGLGTHPDAVYKILARTRPFLFKGGGTPQGAGQPSRQFLSKRRIPRLGLRLKVPHPLHIGIEDFLADRHFMVLGNPQQGWTQHAAWVANSPGDVRDRNKLRRRLRLRIALEEYGNAVP